MTRYDADATIELLKHILTDAPALDGAACDGRHELFDAAHRGEDRDQILYRHRAAQAICVTCPALDACTGNYLEVRSARRPPGVLDGRRPQLPRMWR